jgi:hypothetical protein
MRRLALWIIFPLLLVLSTAGLAVLSASRSIESIALSEEVPLVHALRVTLRMSAPLDVDYWTDDGPRLSIRSDAARSHVVWLTRLRPDRLYHFQIRQTGTQGSFRTAALPADLAAIRFDSAGLSTTPLVVVHVFKEDGFKGYVVLDDSGQVVWFWRTKDYPFGSARRHNGNFVFMDKGRGIVEVTPAGQVVRELPQQDAERELHHEVITTPWDTVLYLAFDTETFEGKRIKGEAIWEWTPESGQLVKRWRSWDHLTPALDRGPRFGGEWMHANSLAIGPRGNIIVSAHYFNQIFSIASDWRGIEWRIGGPRASVTLPSGDEFSGQHTARELVPGRLLLFDNGRDRGGYSRVVELEIEGSTAKTRWAWQPRRANFSSAVSSARRLDNGHTL